MSQLIIGHTTDTSARIWVQADKARRCEVVLSGGRQAPPSQTTELSPSSGGTGIVDFAKLDPSTPYTVTATFGPQGGQETGAFTTMSSDPMAKFSFVLSSCNLSVVSVSNLMAFILAAVGAQAARDSLDIPPERWRPELVLGPFKFKWPRSPGIRRFLARVFRLFLMLAAGVVQKATGMKQPGPPFFRSPFLKLNAVFDSQVVCVEAIKIALPKVGNTLYFRSDKHGSEGVIASGVLASAPTDATGEPAPAPDVVRPWLLVLTQVTGEFPTSGTLFWKVREPETASLDADSNKLPFVYAGRGHQWYPPPAFFLHAGDQIYYDFPDPRRVPERDAYRLAYREAWGDDVSNRYLLAHFPHYMTLDDHEIADQFARDFKPPSEEASRDYFTEATDAYRAYVHARHPAHPTPPSGAADDSCWYTFSRGQTQFFVLDTRLARFDGRESDSQIIDPFQMKCLLAWLKEYKHVLKFVVTSVPFVAQVRDVAGDETEDWFAGNRSSQGRSPRAADEKEGDKDNPANDKWSAPRFRSQRDQIIECIEREGVEQLVFLSGDTHCCYHATMHIGSEKKYERTVVHELAAGPANQLQLADVTDFHQRSAGATSAHGVKYEVVLERFHSEVNAVMHVQVAFVARTKVVDAHAGIVPEVEWNVIRTLTDTGASAWVPLAPTPGSASEGTSDRGDRGAGRADKTRDNESVRLGEPTMSGRISFVRKRRVDELAKWPNTPTGAADHVQG